jgi:FkbM family methyltransferase
MGAKNLIRRTALRAGLRISRPGSRLHDSLVAASQRTDLRAVRDFSVATSHGRIRLCDPSRWLVPKSLYWFGSRGYEPGTIEVLAPLARRSATFLDVGANTGYYGLFAAKENPRLSVYAFEPAPQTYEQLLENVEVNGLRNVTPIRCAVGDRSGTARLYLSDDDCTASTLPGFRQARQDVEVPMLTIDQFVAERGLDRVDLIKIDVEGTEDKILHGAQRVLRGHRPVVICEVLAGRNEEKLQSIAEQVEYRYAKITEHGLRPQEVIRGHTSYADLNYLFWPNELAAEELLVDSFAESASLSGPL